jgi:hypothetical protein
MKRSCKALNIKKNEDMKMLFTLLGHHTLPASIETSYCIPYNMYNYYTLIKKKKCLNLVKEEVET